MKKRNYITQIFLLLVFFFLSASLVSATFVLESGETAQGNQDNSTFIVLPVDQPPQVQDSQVVSAQNIVIQSRSVVSVISCHVATEEIILTNTHSFPVQVSIESSYSKTSFSANGFFLGPGETRTVLMTITPGCVSSRTLTQKLTFTIDSLVKELRQDIDIRRVSNIEGFFTKTKSATCPLTPTQYELQLRNPLPFSDVYSLSTNNKFDPIVSFSESIFSLSGNAVKSIAVTITPTPDMLGDFTIPITIETRNNGFISSNTLHLSISQDCFTFSVAGPSTFSVCEDGFTKNVSYTLENKAGFENHFDISLRNAPSFANLEGELLTLSHDQKGIVPMTLEPRSQRGWFSLWSRSFVGNYSAQLVAESVFGDVLAIKDIAIEVQPCYSFDVSSESQNFDVCAGDSMLQVALTNTGFFEEVFSIDLESSRDGAEFLTESQVTLKPNETTLLPISFSNVTRKTSLLITATIANNTLQQESISLELVPRSNSDCYGVTILESRVFIDVIDNQTMTIIPLTLFNKGLREITTNISLLNNTDYIFLNDSLVLLASQSAQEFFLGTENRFENVSSERITFLLENDFYRATKEVTLYTQRTYAVYLYGLLLLLLLLLLILFLVFLLGKKKTASSKKKSKEILRKQKVSSLKNTTSFSKNESAKKTQRLDKKRSKGTWLFLLFAVLFLVLCGVILLGIAGYLYYAHTSESVYEEDEFFMEEEDIDYDTTVPPLDDEEETSVSRDSFASRVGSFFSSITGFFSRESNETQELSLNETSETTDSDSEYDVSKEDVSSTDELELQEDKSDASKDSFLRNILSRVTSFFSFNTTQNVLVDSEELNETTLPETNETVLDTTDEVHTTIDDDVLTRDPFFFSDSPCPEVSDIKEYILVNNLTSNFQFQIIPRNGMLEFNFSRLFYDPDGDNLTFSMEPMNNISIFIDGEIGRLIPDIDFCGVRETVIIATDTSGAFATSPPLYIIVDEKPSFTTFFNSFNGLVVLFLIVLICLSIAGLLFLKD